jgi:hypothetical protein
LKAVGSDAVASYFMGDTPILMMAQGLHPTAARADALAALIEGNIDHPARELMWGAPGTLLAALFLHERSGDDARWAALFRATPSSGRNCNGPRSTNAPTGRKTSTAADATTSTRCTASLPRPRR